MTLDNPLENEYLETALEAAESAAEVQKREFRKTREKEYKAPRDIVTQADFESEKRIKQKINDEHPEHAILGEETGETESESEYRWIVDPLDGTMNFFHGVPHFSVSIALEIGDELEVGLVYHTFREDAYTAVNDEGAYLNDESLSVSPEEEFSESLITTGFSAETAQEPERFEILRQLVRDTHGIRRFGSAALDLTDVSHGVVEGFYEDDLNSWDVAAGSLIVEEAGGKVTDFDGEQDGRHVEKGEVVATNGVIHDELLDILDF